MGENFYKHECKRLREENEELKKQLKFAKEKEHEIDAIRTTYTDSIIKFIETKDKYNELVKQIREAQKSYKKQLDTLVGEMRKK